MTWRKSWNWQLVIAALGQPNASWVVSPNYLPADSGRPADFHCSNLLQENLLASLNLRVELRRSFRQPDWAQIGSVGNEYAIADRTFGWIGRFRPNSKDYERNPKSSDAMSHTTMIALMLERLEIAQLSL